MKKPIRASDTEAPAGKSIYPEVFSAQVAGRTKRKLGDLFDLSNFGVNLTELAPGSVSALAHFHLRQDEFVYMLEGCATLILGDATYVLEAGDCCGFRAGVPIAHQIRNDSDSTVRYLEIGDRTEGDSAEFPNDDIKAVLQTNGQWKFTRKNGADF